MARPSGVSRDLKTVDRDGRVKGPKKRRKTAPLSPHRAMCGPIGPSGLGVWRVEGPVGPHMAPHFVSDASGKPMPATNRF